MLRQGGHPGRPGLDTAPNRPPSRPKSTPRSTPKSISYRCHSASRSTYLSFIIMLIDLNPYTACRSSHLSFVVAIINTNLSCCILFVLFVVHHCEHRSLSVRISSACTSHNGRYLRSVGSSVQCRVQCRVLCLQSSITFAV